MDYLLRKKTSLTEEIECGEPSDHCISHKLVIIWSINHVVLRLLHLFSCAWFDLVLRIWNVCSLYCVCEKFFEFWNVWFFIYVLGWNALVRWICFYYFVLCNSYAAWIISDTWWKAFIVFFLFSVICFLFRFVLKTCSVYFCWFSVLIS